jgi:hypothetical protein
MGVLFNSKNNSISTTIPNVLPTFSVWHPQGTNPKPIYKEFRFF